jgi:L-ascorbate metabolism protein UlaG (beta-lactamase superfamily)
LKILGKILLSLLALIIAVLLFVGLYFQFATRVGTTPKGERLARIEASPNYRDGVFHNLIETNMDIPWRAIAAVVWEGIVGGKESEPRDTIPTIPFDRAAWNIIPETDFAVAWFGHSTVLIKIDGLTILCDPVFSERGSAFTFVGPKRFPYTHQPRLEDLPHVDVVLLSHDHYDHLDYRSILYLKDRVEHWLMPLGVGAHLEYWGMAPEKIREFDWWEGTSVESLELTLAPSRHFSGRGISSRFSTLWGAWVVKGREHTLLFGGDSGYSPSFSEIGDRFGPFDLVMLECGAYNEAWADIHLFPEELPLAATDLRAKALMPIHWGKFDLALHPWKDPIERLSAAMFHSSIPLFTPRVGRITTNADPAFSEQWWTGLN